MPAAGAREFSRTGLGQSTYDISAASQWFAEHVKLFGQPYTLDADQVRAAIDQHTNTLVTARAGSGKTRVIVAKVAYLVAKCGYSFDEIAIFMFNRTAAAEVNSRIMAVKVDGAGLADFRGHPEATAEAKRRDPVTTGVANAGRENTGKPCLMASTFHKYALDIVKAFGDRPQIIDEVTHADLISCALNEVLAERNFQANPKTFQELLGIVNGFIARAGQQFPGQLGLKPLQVAVENYCAEHRHQDTDRQKVFWHEVALATYFKYVQSLTPPQTDFNFLMARAAEILCQLSDINHLLKGRISKLKIIMIDEYQDFSYLFYNLVQSIRILAPAARLFAVGDDWQAINRFAGSDVNYFINFADYFPEDAVNIPLATNYRSCRKIVEHANDYMLKHYDPQAIWAVPFQKKSGKVHYLNPEKMKFNSTDIYEDAAGDGRFQLALSEASGLSIQKVPTSAAKLLKTLVKIIKHHRSTDIMLLHRHNFTSFNGIDLVALERALKTVLEQDAIIPSVDFERQIRFMTVHKSKGLEAEVVILLEMNQEIIHGAHPHATIFELFGDTRAAEVADQDRLIYVALTRAKEHLYLLSSDNFA